MTVDLSIKPFYIVPDTPFDSTVENEIAEKYDKTSKEVAQAYHLTLCAELGKNATLQGLVDSGVSIDAKSRSELSPLHLAVLFGTSETVNLILQTAEKQNKIKEVLTFKYRDDQTPIWFLGKTKESIDVDKTVAFIRAGNTFYDQESSINTLHHLCHSNLQSVTVEMIRAFLTTPNIYFFHFSDKIKIAQIFESSTDLPKVLTSIFLEYLVFSDYIVNFPQRGTTALDSCIKAACEKESENSEQRIEVTRILLNAGANPLVKVGVHILNV